MKDSYEVSAYTFKGEYFSKPIEKVWIDFVKSINVRDDPVNVGVDESTNELYILSQGNKKLMLSQR